MSPPSVPPASKPRRKAVIWTVAGLLVLAVHGAGDMDVFLFDVPEESWR